MTLLQVLPLGKLCPMMACLLHKARLLARWGRRYLLSLDGRNRSNQFRRLRWEVRVFFVVTTSSYLSSDLFPVVMTTTSSVLLNR